MKFKTILIFILVLAVFCGVGFYFKSELTKFWNDSSSHVAGDLQKINVGELALKIERQVLNPAPLEILGAQSNVILLQSKIISETNLQRHENGNLPALKENKKLNEAAVAKAADLFKNQYFDHVSPAGIDPGKLVQNHGYDYIIAGENLILGNFSSEKEVVQDWMDSPGHRANILNNRYSEIGVAIVKGTYKGQTVWIGVQEFGLPMANCAEPNLQLKNEIETNKTQIDYLASQIDEKKKEVENANPKSAVYSQMVIDYNALVDSYNQLVQTVKDLIAQYNGQVNVFNNCISGK